MARSRHGRSGGRPRADAGLPSWAQRHLDEAGDTAIIPAAPAPPVRRQHRAAAAAPSGLRGWGVAIVSVAAAVGAVPLAVSSLANDHSDDPLPKVDTYTAGRPGPLQAEPGGTRSGAPAAPQRDQATAGVLDEPPAAPVAQAPVAPRRAAPVPVPAAVVRSTHAVVAPAKPVTPTTTATTKGRSATPPPATTTKPPTSQPSSGSTGGGRSGGSSDEGSDGGGGGLVGTVGKTVGGLTNTVGGVAHGLLG
jgi:hypothetical protein